MRGKVQRAEEFPHKVERERRCYTTEQNQNLTRSQSPAGSKTQVAEDADESTNKKSLICEQVSVAI